MANQIKAVIFDLAALVDDNNEPVVGVDDIISSLRARGIAIAVVAYETGPLYRHYQPWIAARNLDWKITKSFPDTSAVVGSLVISLTSLDLHKFTVVVSTADDKILDLLNPDPNTRNINPMIVASDLASGIQSGLEYANIKSFCTAYFTDYTYMSEHARRVLRVDFSQMAYVGNLTDVAPMNAARVIEMRLIKPADMACLLEVE